MWVSWEHSSGCIERAESTLHHELSPHPLSLALLKDLFIMCLCLCVYMCVEVGMPMRTWGDQNRVSVALLDHSLLIPFQQAFSLNLGLSKS